jgi:hypothetical protein
MGSLVETSGLTETECPPILPSLPRITALALEVNTAITLTAFDGSATLGKFIAGTVAGVTMTASPIASSIAAETVCIADRQFSEFGNNIFVP